MNIERNTMEVPHMLFVFLLPHQLCIMSSFPESEYIKVCCFDDHWQQAKKKRQINRTLDKYIE
jgi:hypothetical protein